MTAEFFVILIVGGAPLVATAIMLYFAERDARRRAARANQSSAHAAE